MSDLDKKNKQSKVAYAILKDLKGWTKRLRVVGPTRIFRYPISHEVTVIHETLGGSIMYPRKDFETVDFEYTDSYEDANHIYYYYREIP